jgi:hypothetical protein
MRSDRERRVIVTVGAGTVAIHGEEVSLLFNIPLDRSQRRA